MKGVCNNWWMVIQSCRLLLKWTTTTELCTASYHVPCNEYWRMMEDDHYERHMLRINVITLAKNGVSAKNYTVVACLRTSKVVHWFMVLHVLKNPGFKTIQIQERFGTMCVGVLSRFWLTSFKSCFFGQCLQAQSCYFCWHFSETGSDSGSFSKVEQAQSQLRYPDTFCDIQRTAKTSNCVRHSYSICFRSLLLIV